MRTVLGIGALFLGSGAAYAAPDQTISMGEGSAVYWTSAYDGGNDQFHETLLVQGDDFAIFRSENEWSEGEVGDHFALFSGIYFITCDMEMPTKAERTALSEMWPLTEGATIDLSSGDAVAYVVGAPTEYFLMGKWHAAHTLSGTYQGDEPSEETLIVLDDMPLTVGLHWEDGSRDAAMLVTQPKSVASTPVDTDLIGNCASLLNNETNEN